MVQRPILKTVIPLQNMLLNETMHM